MENIKINVNNIEFSVQDFRNTIKDYRELHKIHLQTDRPDFIPKIDIAFFMQQGYSIPVVKIDSLTYLFPTNADNTNKKSQIADYKGYCVTDLDIFIATQNYYYNIAKIEYDNAPEFGKKYRYVEGNLILEEYKIALRKRGSNTMSWVQYNLNKAIYDEKTMWQVHGELQDEIKYKQSDFKLQCEESENPFTKGEFTSYGKNNLSEVLFEKYGVHIKLQDGSKIQLEESIVIEKGLSAFFNSVKDLSALFKEFDMIISYSKEKHMHARSAIGIFYPYFRAIGVSNIGNFNRTLSHEIGHFIDYRIGDMNKRNYSSDDKNHISGQIAYVFRKNMRKRQSSEYRNRTKECFARAIEQFFCIKNAIYISEKETDYCEQNVFLDKVEPLIVRLIETI
jgi:hypothetical protein